MVYGELNSLRKSLNILKLRVLYPFIMRVYKDKLKGKATIMTIYIMQITM